MAGIYIHIPFCHRKCAYCDFYSVAARPGSPVFAAIVEKIQEEYHRRLPELGAESVNTLYIGGGTPSLLPAESIADLCQTILPDHPGICEITLEANPEDVTPQKVRTWKQAGINRVSIGIQSFDDDALAKVGRRHSGAQALAAIDILRGQGIENISGDLIYSLPGDTPADWQRNLNTLLRLRLPHLSAYCLSYEAGTLLTRRLQRGDIVETPEDNIVDMYSHLCSMTAEAGYEHYEISNFCLPGQHSRHNSSYWTGEPYLGLGPAAHSFDGTVRRYNIPDIHRYLGGEAPVIEDETPENRVNDRIMTGLRRSAGLDLDDIPENFHAEILRNALPHLRTGNLRAHGHILTIPEDRWLVSDGIIIDLMV